MSDQCPAWAADLIHKIRELELKLGNIAAASEWQVSNIQDIYRRSEAADEDYGDDESAVEALFAKVARGLAKDGFRPDEIASFINSRIPSGGRLPYCNAAEVSAAL